METFPEAILLSYPLTTQIIFKTLRTDFDTGKDKRYKKWTYPKRLVKLNHKLIDTNTTDGIKLLWEFYQKRLGAYETFYFYWPFMRYWYGEYVGIGNGIQTYFILSSFKEINPSSLKVYIDGVGTAVTFIVPSVGGEWGASQWGEMWGGADDYYIQFASPPAKNAIITADVYCKLKLTCRFEQDSLDDELFTMLLYNASVNLLEVKS